MVKYVYDEIVEFVCVVVVFECFGGVLMCVCDVVDVNDVCVLLCDV